MDIKDIRDTIVELSGSGKRVAPGARRHGIYCSFTLPGLDDMEAVRDTRQRFRDYGFAEPTEDVREDELCDKRVIDVGCNVGAIAFEFARRGAIVTGVEYRDDRVALCRAIARQFNYQDSRFEQADLNDLIRLNPIDNVPMRPSWYESYDVVWCASVDEYIGPKEHPQERDDMRLYFYRMLRHLTAPGGRCYLESNLQEAGSKFTVESELSHAGFDVKYVGDGHSGGIARKRKLFVGTPK